MTRWLIVAVLAVPLAAWPGLSLAETKNHAFLAAGGLGAIALVANPWVRLFAAWTVVAYLLAGAAAWALHGVLGVLAWALLFQLASTLSESAWRNVRLAVVASALVQVLWMGVQAAHLDPVFSPTITQAGVLPTQLDPHGWFGNQMDLALYLGVALPMLAAVQPSLALLTAAAMAWWLPTTVGALAIAISAVWVAGGYVHGRLARAACVLGVLALGVAYVVQVDPQGPGLKPEAWVEGVRATAERPLTGWGPNALDHRVFLVSPRIAVYWNFLFNEWVQGALELGVVGPLCAAGFLGSLMWRLRGRLEQAAELTPTLVILVIASVCSIPFRIGPVALLAALALGQLDRRLA